MRSDELFKGFEPVSNQLDIPQQTQLSEKLAIVLGNKKLRKNAPLPSIREVARHFKVNQFTVQKVFDHLSKRNCIFKKPGKGSYASQVQERILFTPCKRLSVSVQNPPPGENFILSGGNLLSGFFIGVSSHGWSVNVEDGKTDGSEFESMLGKFRNRLSDGVAIIGGMGAMTENITAALEAGMPIILVNNIHEGVCSVVAGMEDACGEMTRRLLKMGIGSFGIFSSINENPRFSDIESGVRGVLEKENIPLNTEFVKMISSTQDDHDQIKKAAFELARKTDFPEAIFCSPESKTLAMSQALEKLGKRHVTIVSIDDPNRVGNVWEHKLYRIKVPYFEMGRIGGEALAGSIAEGKLLPSKKIQVECPLIFDHER